MIKKISTYIFLITFSSVVSAQEILMDCKTGKYRYINNDSGTEILFMDKYETKVSLLVGVLLKLMKKISHGLSQ